MSIQWRKEHIVKFILFVQQHPCLYRVKSLEFLDRNLKAQAFIEIMAQMEEYIPNISVDDVKGKLRNLRTQFLHEQRMIKHSKNSGKSDVYVPKLWCYGLLSFLENEPANRPCKDEMEACENTISNYCEEYSLLEIPPKKRGKIVVQNIKTPIKWRREHIEKFIGCVEEHPCLYNLESSEYLDRNLKAQALNEILAQMQQCIPNITVVDLKKKLRNMRTQFMHEQRMVNRSMESGCRLSDIYVPKLWCYDQLLFLSNHVDNRPSEDSMEGSNVPSTSGAIAKQTIVDERSEIEEIKTLLENCENTSSCDDSSPFEKSPRKRAMKEMQTPIKWKREHIEKFIRCIQEHPCLYTIKSLENLDRTLKSQAYNEILAEMQECIPNITIGDLKKKFKNLRTQFMHEQRMIRRSKESGCRSSDIYVAKLWCYDQLLFLKNHTQGLTASEDNMEVTNVPSTSGGIAKQRILDKMREDGVKTTPLDGENINSSAYADFSRFENKPGKRTKKVSQREFLQEIESFQKSILSQRKTTKAFDWLGKLVASQMEKINPDDQPDAAWKVQCLMRELTNNAVRKPNTAASSSATCKNIIELSMAGVFDDPDFE